jgi:hypothetical protein
MSDMSSAGAEKTGSSKKKVSPARNAIGIVVLIAVVVFGWLQYSAKSGYNAAATALNGRIEDEDKGLLMVDEAERLIGKAPDGPGSDTEEGNRTFTKKTYSWPGVLKSYTLTAFYTKEANPYLHHFEAGAKLAAEPIADAKSDIIRAPVPGETPKGSRPTTARAPMLGKMPSGPKSETTAAPVPAKTADGSKPETTTAPVPAKTADGSKPETTTAPVPAKTADGSKPDTTTAPGSAKPPN